MREDALARFREALRTLERMPAGDAQAAAARRVLQELAGTLEWMARREAVLAAQQQLMEERLLRVERNRLFRWWGAVMGRLAALPRRLGSRAGDATPPEQYAMWVAHEQAALPAPEEAARAVEGWRSRPRFSVVTQGGAERNGRAIESLREQVYGDWEIQETDCTGEAQWPGALFEAARNSAGDYLVLLDAEDALAPFALYFTAEALQAEPFDIAYADEDRLDGAGCRCRPRFKPGWSPVLLRRRMYLGRPLILRREWILQRGCAPPQDCPAPFHAFVRQLAHGARVRHIPKVLAHRPLHGSEDASLAEPLPEPRGPMTAVICSRSAQLLEECLRSLRATAGRQVPEILVVAHEEGGANPALREAAQKHGAKVMPHGGPFHFARMCNQAAAAATTPYLLFLNDDVTASQPGWAEPLAGALELPGVAIAGAVLRYPSGGIQHAGVVTGISDGAGHAGRGQQQSDLWPWLLETRNVTAVTGACMAVRADAFAALEGFDAAFPNNYNDIDLCLRAGERGWQVACVATAGLVHAECQTRRGVVRFEERLRLHERWAHVLALPDPYYSPSLARSERIGLRMGGETVYTDLLAEALPEHLRWRSR